VVLDECVAESLSDSKSVFDEYFARRKENTDVLADFAVENFIRCATSQPRYVTASEGSDVITSEEAMIRPSNVPASPREISIIPARPETAKVMFTQRGHQGAMT
jgi:hypothetical protein